MKKYAFLNFGHIFQNVYFGYPVNSIVSSAQALRLYKIHVFDEAFFLLIVRMPYGHQTSQGIDIPQGAPS